MLLIVIKHFVHEFAQNRIKTSSDFYNFYATKPLHEFDSCFFQVCFLNEDDVNNF